MTQINIPDNRPETARKRTVASWKFRMCCLICSLILLLMILCSNVYSRTYLALARRFKWEQPYSYWIAKDLEGCDLSHMSFRNANFVDARLHKVNFAHSDLLGCYFEFAHMEGANFDGGNLNSVNLNNSYSAGASFRYADLTYARLGGKLSGADFTYANLREAELDGAGLDGAKLDGANLAGAHYNDYTVWPQGFHPENHPEMVNDGKGYWAGPFSQ